MTKPGGLSLADLDARTHGADAHEFEYTLPDGSGSGVWLSVFGGQSEGVTKEINRLVNERRKREAVMAAKGAVSRANAAEFTPVEDDVAFGQRLSAVRLAGWRGPGQTEGLTADQKERFQGISDPFTPDNALRLCQTNADVSSQILEESNTVGNFLKLSSPTS